ncbi:MAG: glycosyltransferase family 2 protein [Chloroflexota bacterium]
MTTADLTVKKKPAQQGASAAVQIELGMANAWLRKGRWEQAIHRFKRVLALEPTMESVYIDLSKIYTHLRRWADVLEISRQGLDMYPNQCKLHKYHINALIESVGWSGARDTYGMERMDHNQIDLAPRDIICCLVLRNEYLRLPYFLTYYRQLGIKHFFVVDNGSDDGSVEFLLNQPDVYLWQTYMSFNRANFGSAWFEILLQKYGIGRWCLTLDADELVTFQAAENHQLIDLCDALDQQGKLAASGLMLDMYGQKPLSQTIYQAGQNFLEVCHYFDRTPYHDEYPAPRPFFNQDYQFGGMRKRVFGEDVEYLVTKTPLIKYKLDTVMVGGQHSTSHPADKIAHLQICVLHFKYFSSFIDYAMREAERGEHSGGGEQYQAYADGINDSDDILFYDPAESLIFSGSQQLLELGIMRDGLRPISPVFPQIAPLTASEPRPFWSVMITVYNRIQFVERVIESVLVQNIPADEMEIIVVNDGGVDSAFRDTLMENVQRIGGDRVRLVCLEDNVGHPHIFNRAVEMASGEWIHILHDDDFVRPGFYDALRTGIGENPNLGAAFTRHALQNGNGEVTWTSWLERESAGVIEDWLDRIAIACRIQFSAMVVRRSTYESIGGYYDQVGSAFDWEMWKRIAVNYPVWFEPKALAVAARDGSAETDQLMIDGRQIADSLLTIPVSRSYLPSEKAEFLSQKAYEQFSLYGLDVVRKQLKAGDFRGALLNIRESLKGDHSGRVIAMLQETLK